MVMVSAINVPSIVLHIISTCCYLLVSTMLYDPHFFVVYRPHHILLINLYPFGVLEAGVLHPGDITPHIFTPRRRHDYVCWHQVKTSQHFFAIPRAEFDVSHDGNGVLTIANANSCTKIYTANTPPANLISFLFWFTNFLYKKLIKLAGG